MKRLRSVFGRLAAHLGRRTRLLTVFLATGCLFALPGATIGGSSWLHVNLSYLPVSYYDTSHPATSYGFSTSCPSGASVQGCFQTILGQMRAQGVSGIRVFVTLCDQSSLAFNNCGQPYTSISWNPGVYPYQQTWIQNLTNFFQDVQNAGIQNVTITLADAPVSAAFSEPASMASSPGGPCSNVPTPCCPDMPSTVYFSPTQPYGADPTSDFPIGDYWNKGSNQGYDCSPVNPYFIGWTNEFNVVNAMLAAAAGRVNIYEFENEQEIDVSIFTVMARYMYDNSSPQSAGLGAGQIVNVVSTLRSLMSANGFDPGRVNWSSMGGDATSAVFNCTNIYTDWSRNWGPDGIASAIGAGYIGINTDVTPTDGLLCGGSDLNSMFHSLPIYSTQPDIVDVHIYSQVAGAANTDADIQSAANTDFGDLPHFLALTGLGSADIVIGETWGGTLSPLYFYPNYCWLGAYQAPAGAPGDNVAGFNSSSLSGYTVTFRPWMELEDPSGQCFAYGGGPGSPTNYQSVNYNGTGPYTPTNR